MADRTDRPHQVQIHTQPGRRGALTGMGGGGPSASKVLAVITLLPIGGSLLGLAGMTLVGTLISLAVVTPIFLICSPVLVPAAFAVALSVFAFLTSGAIGLTGISSLSWALQSVRQATGTMPNQLEETKKRVQEMAVQMGQKTKEVGQTIETKAKESGK
ncbi:oleosin 18.2 kDa-like [Impatiens glandulifera]|uniref:oleosin 18.2 kDa-like n=1 Tax=Impatiens glandulifera TaxID=253017 RepID=UPI001FB05F38|nr:oleosin 18.2 kDa-like [Impatiens glandulifera]